MEIDHIEDSSSDNGQKDYSDKDDDASSDLSHKSFQYGEWTHHMDKQDSQGVFEIRDYTTSTSFERLSRSIELILAEWQKDGLSSNSFHGTKTNSFLHETKFTYQVYLHKEKVKKHISTIPYSSSSSHSYNSLLPALQSPSPWDRLSNPSTFSDFPTTDSVSTEEKKLLEKIQTYFGVSSFLLLCVTSPLSSPLPLSSSQQTFPLSHSTFPPSISTPKNIISLDSNAGETLLSSFYLAAKSANWSLPLFVHISKDSSSIDVHYLISGRLGDQIKYSSRLIQTSPLYSRLRQLFYTQNPNIEKVVRMLLSSGSTSAQRLTLKSMLLHFFCTTSAIPSYVQSRLCFVNSSFSEMFPLILSHTAPSSDSGGGTSDPLKCLELTLLMDSAVCSSPSVDVSSDQSTREYLMSDSHWAFLMHREERDTGRTTRMRQILDFMEDFNENYNQIFSMRDLYQKLQQNKKSFADTRAQKELIQLVNGLFQRKSCTNQYLVQHCQKEIISSDLGVDPYDSLSPLFVPPDSILPLIAKSSMQLPSLHLVASLWHHFVQGLRAREEKGEEMESLGLMGDGPLFIPQDTWHTLQQVIMTISCGLSERNFHRYENPKSSSLGFDQLKKLEKQRNKYQNKRKIPQNVWEVLTSNQPSLPSSLMPSNTSADLESSSPKSSHRSQQFTEPDSSPVSSVSPVSPISLTPSPPPFNASPPPANPSSPTPQSLFHQSHLWFRPSLQCPCTSKCSSFCETLYLQVKQPIVRSYPPIPSYMKSLHQERLTLLPPSLNKVSVIRRPIRNEMHSYIKSNFHLCNFFSFLNWRHGRYGSLGLSCVSLLPYEKLFSLYLSSSFSENPEDASFELRHKEVSLPSFSRDKSLTDDSLAASTAANHQIDFSFASPPMSQNRRDSDDFLSHFLEHLLSTRDSFSFPIPSWFTDMKAIDQWSLILDWNHCVLAFLSSSSSSSLVSSPLLTSPSLLSIPSPGASFNAETDIEFYLSYLEDCPPKELLTAFFFSEICDLLLSEHPLVIFAIQAFPLVRVKFVEVRDLILTYSYDASDPSLLGNLFRLNEAFFKAENILLLALSLMQKFPGRSDLVHQMLESDSVTVTSSDHKLSILDFFEKSVKKTSGGNGKFFSRREEEKSFDAMFSSFPGTLSLSSAFQHWEKEPSANSSVDNSWSLRPTRSEFLISSPLFRMYATPHDGKLFYSLCECDNVF